MSADMRAEMVAQGRCPGCGWFTVVPGLPGVICAPCYREGVVARLAECDELYAQTRALDSTSAFLTLQQAAQTRIELDAALASIATLTDALREVRDEVVRPDRPYHTAGVYVYSHELIQRTVARIDSALFRASPLMSNKREEKDQWA